MLYGEKLKEILSKTGVDTTTLPDNLFSTMLQAISDNIGNNTGGGTGGGEITYEQAFCKLLPNESYRPTDIADIDGMLAETGTTLRDIKLYYTNLSNEMGSEVSKISAGTRIIFIMKVNSTTMETSVYIYGNSGITLDYDPSIFSENGCIVILNIGVTITDITLTSGKMIFVGSFQSVVM